MASKVSTEREKELRKLFEKLDINKDGGLSAKEVQAALKTIGKEISMEQAEKIVKDADVNGDGEIDVEEFLAAMTKNEERTSKMTRQTLIDAFRAWDKNGDEHLSRDELLEVMKSIGKSFSKEEMTSMVAEVDKNGDGVISLDEFLNLFLD